MGVTIRVSDYVIELSDSTLFTPELKAEIADFILGRSGYAAASRYKTREIKRRWDEAEE
jgi:hypothetical protein